MHGEKPVPVSGAGEQQIGWGNRTMAHLQMAAERPRRTDAPSGRMIELKAEDGAAVGCYHAPAQGPRQGGLVLIQEIFGVTDHIRELADGFAVDGYEVLAPALFDRTEKGFEAEYDEAGIARGRSLAQAVDWDLITADLRMCVDRLKDGGPVFTVGYCFGGTVAWLAACRVKGLAAVSSYYGRLIVDFLDETPRCPTILHFGHTDPTIPMDSVDRIAEAHPDVRIHLYPAGHGFNSDRRADYDEGCARLARLRTMAHFRAHMNGHGINGN